MNFEKELARVKPKKDTLFTIGVFDGVHLGHQYLLARLKERARQNGWLSGVLTFKTHPEMVIDRGSNLAWINDLDTRVNMIKETGIDLVLAVDFDEELKGLSARDFMELLKKYLRLRGLVVGPDFALGKNRSGDIEQLKLLGKEMDFTIEVVEPYKINGEEVKSNLVRQTLNKGDMRKVARLLGKTFHISGKVVSGDRRGSGLGYPTINLELNPEMASPPNGVYATITGTGDRTYPSVTNVGVRPTFGGGKRLIETFLFNFKGNLNNKNVNIEFMERIREEKKFNSPDELTSQIKKDAEKAIFLLTQVGYKV